MSELDKAILEAKCAAYVEFRDAVMNNQYEDPWNICAALLNKAEGIDEPTSVVLKEPAAYDSEICLDCGAHMDDCLCHIADLEPNEDPA